MSAENIFPRISRRPRARRTTADRLRDALLGLGEHHGQVLSHTEKAWVSITFAGTRHTLSILFTGEEAVSAGERFIAALPDHEFTISGQLVADAGISAVDHRMVPGPRMVVECELLMLEDA